MAIPILLFILGLIFLIKGGDWFVDGATGIAHRFHVPEILIGATIVSIGTTLPEVMVSTTSAFSGHGEIAYGNALGSIICNTALIAAITVAIRPSTVDRKALRTPVIFFFASAAIYVAIASIFGTFTRIFGFILFLIFVGYMTVTVRSVKKTPKLSESVSKETEAAEPKGTLIKNIILLIIGAALIAVGSNLLVDNGTLIAKALGVPEAVIALTFVALGTSLPELVTAVSSLIKGHGALSLGNIIGANLFNLVLVSSVSAVVHPYDIPSNHHIAGINSSLIVDIPVMLGVMGLLCIPALCTGKLKRWQGVTLLLIYAGFCTFQFMTNM